MLKKFGWVFASNIGNTAMTLFTSVLLARSLGPEGRGLMTAVLLWPMVLMWACGLSLGSATVYYGSSDPGKRPALFANMLAVSGCLGVPACLLAAWALRHLLPLTAQQARLLDINLAMLPALAFFDQATYCLQAAQRIEALSFARVCNQVVITGLLAALWLSRRLDVAGAVAATWAGAWVQGALILAACRRHGLTGRRPDWPLLRESLRYALPQHVGGLATVANLRLDQMVMSAAVPHRVLGLYAFAVNLTELLRQISSAVNTVLFPRLAGEQNGAARRELAARGARWTLVVQGAAAALLALCAPWLVRAVWGTKFVDAIPAVYVLLPGAVLFGAATILATSLRGDGRTGGATLAEVASLAVTAPLLLLLLPRLGIIGAALASTAAYGVYYAVASALFARAFGRECYRRTWPRAEDWAELKRAGRAAGRRLRTREGGSHG